MIALAAAALVIWVLTEVKRPVFVSWDGLYD